jgi:hypothetical protein
MRKKENWKVDTKLKEIKMCVCLWLEEEKVDQINSTHRGSLCVCVFTGRRRSRRRAAAAESAAWNLEESRETGKKKRHFIFWLDSMT